MKLQLQRDWLISRKHYLNTSTATIACLIFVFKFCNNSEWKLLKLHSCRFLFPSIILFVLTAPLRCAFDRNMVLAERCALLSVEILKSQGKYSEAATLLIKMTSEVRKAIFLSVLFVGNHPGLRFHTPLLRSWNTSYANHYAQYSTLHKCSSSLNLATFCHVIAAVLNVF